MLNENQLKKAVEFADGFEFTQKCGNLKICDGTIFADPMFIKDNPVYYPLLLQRAIEGVNRRYFCEGSKSFPWLILNSSCDFRIYKGASSAVELYEFDPHNPAEIDVAKEQALIYVFERMKA